MRWPLRYQILAPFSAILLLALLGVSLLNAILAARHEKQQIETRLADITGTLRTETFPLSDSVLQQMRGLSGAEFVLTSKSEGTVAGTIPLADDFRPPAPSRPAEPFHLESTVEMNGESYFYAAVGIRSPSGQPAPLTLHIFYPERRWRETRWQAMAPPLIAGAVTLALVTLVAVALTRRLTRPISQLRTQVERVAQGNFEPIPLPARDDELRDLVASVNSLAWQLDDLEQAIKRTERFSLLGQLSGGLAHHLRNTVTGARMAVQLHQRHCREIDQPSLDVALRQLALTEQQLQTFLAAGKPSAPRRVASDLRRVVSELVALIEPSCRHRRVDFQFDAAGGPLHLSADPDQLRQALLNLVLNAVDAAGPGGWVRIELQAAPTGKVVVKVIDSGPGPSEELVERLFEPFVTSKPEGVGLGLAVARQVAVAHGGGLKFESRSPTTFVLTLPGGDEASPDAASLATPAVYHEEAPA